MSSCCACKHESESNCQHLACMHIVRKTKHTTVDDGCVAMSCHPRRNPLRSSLVRVDLGPTRRGARPMEKSQASTHTVAYALTYPSPLVFCAVVLPPPFLAPITDCGDAWVLQGWGVRPQWLCRGCGEEGGPHRWVDHYRRRRHPGPALLGTSLQRILPRPQVSPARCFPAPSPAPRVCSCLCLCPCSSAFVSAPCSGPSSPPPPPPSSSPASFPLSVVAFFSCPSPFPCPCLWWGCLCAAPDFFLRYQRKEIFPCPCLWWGCSCAAPDFFLRMQKKGELPLPVILHSGACS